MAKRSEAKSQCHKMETQSLQADGTVNPPAVIALHYGVNRAVIYLPKSIVVPISGWGTAFRLRAFFCSLGDLVVLGVGFWVLGFRI